MDNIVQEILKKNEAEIARLLKEAAGNTSKEQMAWLTGYCAGVTEANKSFLQIVGGLGKVATGVPEVAAGAHGASEITLLFSSHSGNGKGLSKLFKAAADAAGISVKIQDMGSFKPRDLKNEKHLLVIVSTHGEGVPPPTAEPLFEFLSGNRAPKLDGLKYSILALGDKTYVHFCKAGVDLDRRLEELGAKRLFERVDCDVDFDEPARRWIGGTLEELKKTVNVVAPVPAVSASVAAMASPASFLPSGGPGSSAKNPLQATVLSKINLNGRGSEKETYHIELSLEGSGIRYQPGDSCGLLAQNSGKFVDEVLGKLEISGADVLAEKEGKTVFELLKNYELTVLTPDVLKRHNSFANSKALREIISDVAHLREYIYGRDFIDLWQEYPAKYSASDLLTVLRPIPARLYSIASSPATYEDEVHLLVSVVRYNSFGRNKEGVASTFWADRILENEKVPIYIKSNEGFRLPQDGSVPVIMVGPGTGVAPFRSFVEERAALGHSGKNWLFFGNPHFEIDFLYQLEWQEHIKEGRMAKMDVAFSRDQKEKVYVQNRIIENAEEIYSWIAEGAYIYVCGDTKRMAPDVNNAFIQVAEKQGGLTHEKAIEFVKDLKRGGRYLEDVY